MGYFRSTLYGVSWMGLLKGSTRLLGFIKIAVIARLLTPSQFGLFGIASLVLVFLEKMTETGVNVFLIQEKKKLSSYIDTAWIVSIIRGGIISLVIILLTPLISTFFNTGQARNLLYLIAVVPLIRGLINPAIVVFQKELNFRLEFMIQFSTSFVFTISSIIIALITKSAISLVWGMIFASLFEMLISHLFIKPKPKLVFNESKFNLVVNRGKWITLAGVFNYLFREGDDIVVGKLLSAGQLGFYQMAYKISILPITEISDTLVKITFPVFVKISEDRKRLKKAFLKTLAATFIVVLPLGVMLYLFAESIVRVFLGENWLDITEVIKILAFFGILQSMVYSVYPLYLSVKKQNYVTYVTLSAIFAMGITIIPLVKNLGIIGAAYSAFIGLLFSIPFVIYFSIRVFNHDLINYER